MSGSVEEADLKVKKSYMLKNPLKNSFATWPVIAFAALAFAEEKALGIELPPGTRSWIEAVSSSSVGVFGHESNMPLVDLLPDHPTHFARASAAITPNSLKAFADSGPNFFTTGAFVYVSKVDTFTLTSDVLPFGTLVEFNANLHIDGKLVREGGPDSAHLGLGQIQGMIGSWDPNTKFESVRVTPFSAAARQSVILPFDNSSVTLEVDFLISVAMVQQIGVPFDIAYQLMLSARNITADARNTANIGFALPEGISISSLDGFSMNPIDPGAVPDMGATAGMLFLALGGLCFARLRAV